MNARETSVFDLSPSEKLQLVEDLWDDLAATPEAVPVHEWQKQELARRKANLTSNPASGVSGEEVLGQLVGLRIDAAAISADPMAMHLRR
jgi:putative addiction module component (TIGR02574 family)